MLYGQFFSHSLKKQVKQISKTTARKLFDSGKTIYLKANKMRFESVWYYPVSIAKSDFNDSFERACNEFYYYNCSNETGKRIQYFVTVE